MDIFQNLSHCQTILRYLGLKNLDQFLPMDFRKSVTRPGKLTLCELENGPVEIMDFLINSMVIFDRFLSVYQAG